MGEMHLHQPLVMVVEDELLLHEGIEEALRAAGFAVAFVQSAEEGSVLLRGPSADYKALIVDINLRGRMLGWDLAKVARQVKPEMAIVYTTAGRGDEWPSHGVPFSLLVQKPFAPAQLVTAVSQLLNKGAP
jgi:DNA-binding response OmpR family regulator